ncbi:MAG TPA: hypothetical protein VKS81_06060 [Bacteroidota bacterium]|nr:hypothetical protein [Bacteroidota bacterium]
MGFNFWKAVYFVGSAATVRWILSLDVAEDSKKTYTQSNENYTGWIYEEKVPRDPASNPHGPESDHDSRPVTEIVTDSTSGTSISARISYSSIRGKIGVARTITRHEMPDRIIAYKGNDEVRVYLKQINLKHLVVERVRTRLIPNLSEKKA